MTVGQIVAVVDVGQSTVSQHLRILAACRFVLVDHVGTASWYRIKRGDGSDLVRAEHRFLRRSASGAVPDGRRRWIGTSHAAEPTRITRNPTAATSEGVRAIPPVVTANPIVATMSTANNTGNRRSPAGACTRRRS
jgi:hypothetical protein